MNAAVVILAVVAAVAVWLVVGRIRSMLDTHRDRLIVEKAAGNMQHRRAMARRVGRGHQKDELTTVQPAERMHGWVFIYVSRRPGEGPGEYVGWAPTRRGARRRLKRWLANGRDQRGRASLSPVLLVLVGLLILAAYAPQMLRHVLAPGAVHWLQGVNHSIASWVKSL